MCARPHASSDRIGRRRDRGVVTGFLVSLVMTLMCAAGLAIDAGRIVATHIEIADHAENAARVGAQEITLIRAGLRVVDPVRARRVVTDYLAAHALTGEVAISERSVTVTVHTEQPTVLLHLLGVATQSASATRSASVVAG